MQSTQLAAVINQSSGPRKRNLSIDANVKKVNEPPSQAKQNKRKYLVTSTTIWVGVLLCTCGVMMTHKMDSYSHSYCT